jgi:hypothetical protein
MHHLAGVFIFSCVYKKAARISHIGGFLFFNYFA